MEDKYKKGNGVIAMYMGAVKVGSFTNNLGTLDKPNIVHDHDLFDMGKYRTMNECYWADTTMKYHRDWNWLKPVLDKIKSKPLYMTIDEVTPENAFTWDFFRLDIFTPIDVAWDAVVKYIEWYNKNITK